MILRPSLIEVVEGAIPALRARVYSADGTLLQASDVADITGALYDLDSAAIDAPVITTMYIAPYSTVVTSLTNDGTWDIDSVGYNVKTGIATDALGVGAHMCRYEMRITETGGEIHTIAWDIHVRGALGA